MELGGGDKSAYKFKLYGWKIISSLILWFSTLRFLTI